jgi:hypothetical protein
MKFIGFERELEAVAWAKQVIGVESSTGFCRAVSAVDDKGDFVFVVVLSNFTKTNIDMHTAARPGSTWASPKAIVTMFRFLFEYVFVTLGVRRVTGLVRASNYAARKFDEHIGFVKEGEMREAFPDGENLIIYGFLKADYEQHEWR